MKRNLKTAVAARKKGAAIRKKLVTTRSSLNLLTNLRLALSTCLKSLRLRAWLLTPTWLRYAIQSRNLTKNLKFNEKLPKLQWITPLTT